MASLPLFISPQYGELLENSKVNSRATPQVQSNSEEMEEERKKSRFFKAYRNEWISNKIEEQLQKKRAKAMLRNGYSSFGLSIDGGKDETKFKAQFDNDKKKNKKGQYEDNLIELEDVIDRLKEEIEFKDIELEEMRTELNGFKSHTTVLRNQH